MPGYEARPSWLIQFRVSRDIPGRAPNADIKPQGIAQGAGPYYAHATGGKRLRAARNDRLVLRLEGSSNFIHEHMAFEGGERRYLNSSRLHHPKSPICRRLRHRQANIEACRTL